MHLNSQNDNLNDFQFWKLSLRWEFFYCIVKFECLESSKVVFGTIAPVSLVSLPACRRFSYLNSTFTYKLYRNWIITVDDILRGRVGIQKRGGFSIVSDIAIFLKCIYGDDGESLLAVSVTWFPDNETSRPPLLMSIDWCNVLFVSFKVIDSPVFSLMDVLWKLA